ncbi:hypothetical protein [Prauserella alba]|uniref:Antibiotic biosynthesis monooxygenase n=1 Tax=Prauserella alba TaxID=176898 RepID=A0ABN1VNF5_9PSEU|nr:hypothetical protein [Prauserella alba]MCP2182083.1 hypothetical protein [Prauserella alba]
MSPQSTPSEPLLLHNTMRIMEGHLDEYKHAVTRAVEFVQQHGPQLMVQVFIDDDELLAHSFQLYPDSAAILRHWELSDPYIHEVMRHCTVERLEMYGEPDQSVTQGQASVATDGITRVTAGHHIGFVRTSQEAATDA